MLIMLLSKSGGVVWRGGIRRKMISGVVQAESLLFAVWKLT